MEFKEKFEKQMSKTVASGTSFSNMLAVLFIGLKLTDLIAWSWFWILSPLWIPWVFAILLMAFVGILKIIIDNMD